MHKSIQKHGKSLCKLEMEPNNNSWINFPNFILVQHNDEFCRINHSRNNKFTELCMSWLWLSRQNLPEPWQILCPHRHSQDIFGGGRNSELVKNLLIISLPTHFLLGEVKFFRLSYKNIISGAGYFFKLIQIIFFLKLKFRINFLLNSNEAWLTDGDARCRCKKFFKILIICMHFQGTVSFFFNLREGGHSIRQPH